jgi:hypothetical protein
MSMTPNDPPKVPTSAAPRSRKFQFAALGLVLVSGLAGLGLARCLRDPGQLPPAAPPPPDVKLPAHLFRGWDKPDFILVLSGEQHGYLMPCGCSHPQKGGLERRYNLINLLEAKGWPAIAADLGDAPQDKGPADLPNIQGLIKYRYSMAALKTMRYAAASFGTFENKLSLDRIIPEWALNEPQPPLLAANFAHKEGAYKSEVHSLACVEKAGLIVGVAGLVGPMVHEVIEKTDPSFAFAPGSKTLPRVLKEMEEKKTDLRVLVFQGSLVHGMKGRKPEVRELVDAFPQFDVILCLTESDPPPSRPTMIGKTMVVTVGYKGQHVGIVGVWKTANPAKPFDLKYQLVELGEDFLTPNDAVAGHPIIAVMQQYKQELKDQNYLAKYPQVAHPNEIAVGKGSPPRYIGSDSCKGCHGDAYTKWEKTPHRHAYQTLVDAKNPALNQFDPECIVCHTVGFGRKTGYRDEATTPKLINVGCESCHGPGSEHRAAEQLLTEGKPSPLSQAWRDVMNPWRTPDGPEPANQREKRLLRADTFCRTCHDTDNDVTWINTRESKAFDRKWLKIWHYEDRAGFKNREALIKDCKKKEAEQKEEDEKKKGH